MNLPFVTVVIATYRREQELKRALSSLGTQNYDNFEIIVVDDNADNVWNGKVSVIVNDFIKEYENIECKLILNSTNQGSAKTRNIGINAAQGDYVTFLDDDDVYLPDKIKNQVTAMFDNEADYCITDLFLYDEKEKLVDKRIRSYLKSFDKEMLIKYHLMYHMTGTDTFMFKKSYLSIIGGFDEIDIGDEYYLMMKAISDGGKFLYLNRCDVKAYVHAGGIGLSAGKDKIDGENRLFDYKKKYFQMIDKNSVKYIVMRHYAVLTLAGVRDKKILFALKNAIRSFVADPVGLYKLFSKR